MIFVLLASALADEPCLVSETAARIEGQAALAAEAWRAGDEATARVIAARVTDGLGCVVDPLDVHAVGALAALLTLTSADAPAWSATASELGGLGWPWLSGSPSPAGPAWLNVDVPAGVWRVDGVPVDVLALSSGRGHVLQRLAGGEVETLVITGPDPRLTAALRQRGEGLVRSRVEILIDEQGEVDPRWHPSPARRPAIVAGSALLVAGGALLGGHFAAASAFEEMEPRSEQEIQRGAWLTNGLLCGAVVAGVAGAGTLGFGVWVDARGGGVWGRW